MKKYSITKVLKTTRKMIFEADTPEEIKAEAERLGLSNFRKPYVYSHIACEDTAGKYYALRQCVIFNDGLSSLPVSPENLAQAFNL